MYTEIPAFSGPLCYNREKSRVLVVPSGNTYGMEEMSVAEAAWGNEYCGGNGLCGGSVVL